MHKLPCVRWLLHTSACKDRYFCKFFYTFQVHLHTLKHFLQRIRKIIFCLKIMFSFETVSLWEGWNTKYMAVEYRKVQMKGKVSETKKLPAKISYFIWKKNCPWYLTEHILTVLEEVYSTLFFFCLIYLHIDHTSSLEFPN